MNTFPPGPKTTMPLGLDFPEKFKADPLGTAAMMRDLGDISHVRMGPVDWYQINTPELIKEVFVTKSKVFGKTDRFKKILSTVDGQGLVLSEGEFWLRQRRIIQPSFNHDKLADYGRIMVEKTDEIITKWKNDQKLDLLEEMTHTTLGVISKILFGTDVGADAKKLGDAVNTISVCLYREFSDIFLFPEWLPLPSKIEKHKAVAVLDDMIERAMQRSDNEGEQNTIIASILAAVDTEGDGKGMTREQARDEAITMFNAGHDSTAAALAWCWYLLCRNEAVYTEFIAQVDMLAGKSPNFMDLAKVPMAVEIAKETLRLYPPAWTVPRQANEETELDGYTIPKGALANMFPYILQRDPRYFDRPEEFLPSRFSKDNEHKIPNFAWVPFGAGPRACIGKDFALMEMQLVLIRVAQRFRFKLQDDGQIEVNPIISLEPKGGVPVVACAR